MLYCNCIRAALVSIFPRKKNANPYDKNTWTKHHWYTSKDRNLVTSCLVVQIRVEYGTVSPKCGFTDKGTKPCPVPIFLLLSLEPSAEFPRSRQMWLKILFVFFFLSFFVCFYNTLLPKGLCYSMVLWQESKLVFTACFPYGGRGILQHHCSVSKF